MEHLPNSSFVLHNGIGILACNSPIIGNYERHGWLPIQCVTHLVHSVTLKKHSTFVNSFLKLNAAIYGMHCALGVYIHTLTIIFYIIEKCVDKMLAEIYKFNV